MCAHSKITLMLKVMCTDSLSFPKHRFTFLEIMLNKVSFTYSCLMVVMDNFLNSPFKFSYHHLSPRLLNTS